MLRTAVPQVARSGVAQTVRAFATPSSSLSANTAPGPFPTDGALSQAERGHAGAGFANPYWEKDPKPKGGKGPGAKDADGKEPEKAPLRQGVMQKLFY